MKSIYLMLIIIYHLKNYFPFIIFGLLVVVLHHWHFSLNYCTRHIEFDTHRWVGSLPIPNDRTTFNNDQWYEDMGQDTGGQLNGREERQRRKGRWWFIASLKEMIRFLSLLLPFVLVSERWHRHLVRTLTLQQLMSTVWGAVNSKGHRKCRPSTSFAVWPFFRRFPSVSFWIEILTWQANANTHTHTQTPIDHR